MDKSILNDVCGMADGMVYAIRSSMNPDTAIFKNDEDLIAFLEYTCLEILAMVNPGKRWTFHKDDTHVNVALKASQ